jgi:hypothetical protein
MICIDLVKKKLMKSILRNEKSFIFNKKLKKMKLVKLSIALLFFVGLILTSCEKHCHKPHEKNHECGNHNGATTLTSSTNSTSPSEVVPSTK